ncbi:MAG TPA: transcriptional regulator, partial [Dehalococcoidia bacterium]|nr:transcriptional regulator [Dehalococcoidia bacterium]
AALYREMLDDHLVFCPPDMPGESNSWHTFVIQIDRRDELRSMLAERGVETAIHYPVPIHLQPAAEQLGYGVGAFPEAERQAKRILTLPVHQNLTDDEIQYICNLVNQFVATQCA